MGRYGQKTGSGFYIYEEPKPIPDPSVIGIIENEAEKLGIKREPMTDAEIGGALLCLVLLMRGRRFGGGHCLSPR